MKRGTLESPEGIWLVHKPKNQSSFKSVAQLRKLTDIRKVGHTGTLDPLAEGLMVLLVGKEYTRQAQALTKLDKVYELEITLGEFSTTDDGEGEKEYISDREASLDEIRVVIDALSGEILQTPPIYSAIKINGKRAYSLARKGEVPEMAARPVIVHWWRDVAYSYPRLTATVKVSSGTYIRSLARSLGESLGTGAYLSALKRTEVGDFQLEDAVRLEKLLEN
jgi:tRNA pseudouridine55 synthase